MGPRMYDRNQKQTPNEKENHTITDDRVFRHRSKFYSSPKHRNGGGRKDVPYEEHY